MEDGIAVEGIMVVVEIVGANGIANGEIIGDGRGNRNLNNSWHRKRVKKFVNMRKENLKQINFFFFPSASFFLLARPPRASLPCMPVITAPHLHLSESALPILNSHPFCGPLSDRHQVQADKAFRHHPIRSFPFPPLASALTLLDHALRPAGVTMPSDSYPRMDACLLSLSAASLALMSLCPCVL